MAKEKTYHCSDTDVVLIVDREYLEKVLSDQESGLVNTESKLSDKLFDELSAELHENFLEFVEDCCWVVEERLEREKRNTNAEKANPHYKVYWKNENAYQKNYKIIGSYKTLADAQARTKDETSSEFDFYQICEVKDGKEKVIVEEPSNRSKNYAL